MIWWHSPRKLLSFYPSKNGLTLNSAEGNLVYGVYVRSVQKQQQFYTERGKWRIGFHKDVDYVVKGFMQPEDVAPLTPYFPNSVAELSLEMQSNIEGGVPRELGAHLLRNMSAFADRVSDFYRTNASRLDNIHELVADEEESLEYTIEELAAKALDMDKSELNDVILFAVHRHAGQQTFIIQKDRSSVFADHYLVQPKRVTTVLETVTTWVHEHQDMLVASVRGKDIHPAVAKNHPLQQFLHKARRLIQLSRKVRSPTTLFNVGPTSNRYEPGQDGEAMVYRETPTEKFTKNDQMIIEYLQLWAIPPRKMTSGGLRAPGSHIMRATGMYTGMEVNAASAPLFMQELGVLPPWANLRVLDLAVRLPGHGISRRADERWEKVLIESERLTSEGMEDRMRSMRTDWGDQPIYCVDDVDAQEIDDGVSLERIPGSDEYWVRVHVANPSAFISHDNMIMNYAASRNQTLYTPERTYPMLPPSLSHANFSLAAGRPTLTFSAKMNRRGEVLETDVRNGTARNVVYITHAKLRSVFETVESNDSTLTVGGTFVPRTPRPDIQETLSPEDEENFRILRDLMLGFREYRLKNGAMDFPNSPDTRVSISAGTEPMQPYNMHDVLRGRYFLGDPIIQLHQSDINPHEVPDLTKRYLVSTLMNLACWVSGKWCAERNLPAIYDGTFYHPEYSPLTNKNLGEYGGESWLELAAPKGVSSSVAMHHMPLGLDAYVKSTSPLRRYQDLLAHYQIEAALRWETEHNKRLSIALPDYDNPDTHLTTENENQNALLPFTHPAIETYINTTRWLRFRLHDISTASFHHWACLLLFRAFYFAECPLPPTYRVILHKPFSQTSLAGTQYAHGYAGTITALGIKCQVVFPRKLESEGPGEMGILSIVEAKITGVDLGRLVVVMEGVRVVKGFERVGEWA